MEDSTKVREIRTGHGRAYQRHPSHPVVNIDWTPATPIAGHRSLTGGKIEMHPTEGKIVQFKETAGSGRKKQVICVRLTADRGGLVELVGLAESMRAELDAEAAAEKARKEAERAAKVAADVAGFEATLPAGYVAIETVKHDPNAADGWGMTDYFHGGVELTGQDVHDLGPVYHHPLGNSYDLRAYVPSDKLADLVERKRAERDAKAAAKEAKRVARAEAAAEKMARARTTGIPVELDRWTEDCDGSAYECSTDIVYRMAMPDGTMATHRTHTH